MFTAEQLLRGGKRYGDAPLLFEMAAPEATDIDDEADWDTAAALAAAGFAAGPAPTPPPPPGGDDSRLMRLRPPGLGAPSPPQPPPPPVGSAGTVLVTAPYLRPCMARLSAVLASFGLAVLLPPPGAGGSEPDDRMGEERLLPLCGGFDAAIAGDDAWTAAVLAAAAPRLKVVAKWGTGVDGIDAPAAAALGVAVRRTPGAHTSAVADSVLAFTLAHARRMSDAQVRHEASCVT